MTYSGRPASIQVYMPAELIAAVDLARGNGLVSRSSWIRRAIMEALARKENGP